MSGAWGINWAGPLGTSPERGGGGPCGARAMMGDVAEAVLCRLGGKAKECGLQTEMWGDWKRQPASGDGVVLGRETEQWFSLCGPQTTSISVAWGRARNADSQIRPPISPARLCRWVCLFQQDFLVIPMLPRFENC